MIRSKLLNWCFFFISFYPVNRFLLEQMHKLDDIPKNEIWKNIHKFAEQMQVE